MPIHTTTTATVTKASALMMPPRLRVSVSMMPGPATASSSSCVINEIHGRQRDHVTARRVEANGRGDDFLHVLDIGVDLRLVGTSPIMAATRPRLTTTATESFSSV